jgi:hypothetical protein
MDLAPAARRLGDEALASPRVAGLIYAGLVALAAAPAALWPIPRGNDIVNHWARLTLYHLAPGDPIAGLYRVHFGLIPNLGVDALYLALCPLLSAQTVVRIALALSIALPALGAWAIHRVLFAKPSPTIWLVPFLSYNVATSVGLLNFAIGMGIAFLGVAYAASRDRLRAGDLIALNALGVALFFCHLIALAAFMLILGLMLVAPLNAPVAALARRASVAALVFVAPLLLVALRVPDPMTYNLSDTVRVSLLYAPVASMTASDQMAGYLLLASTALALPRGLTIAPRATLAVAGFALAAMLSPSAWGAGALIDARLKVYLWYFAIAATSLRMADGVRLFAAVAATAMTAARLYAVAPAWAAFQERAETIRAGLAALPQGARALVVSPGDCKDPEVGSYGSLTVFAVIDRRAYVNTLFAQSGIQPVAPADPALDGGPTIAMDERWLSETERATLPAHLLNKPWSAAFRDWRKHFTHVIDAHAGCASKLDASGLSRIGGAPGLDVYRID